nr:OnnG [symbiont bacterium of Theonella swinhoei]
MNNQLADALKERLFNSISANLDMIGYVEDDLRRLAGPEFDPEKRVSLLQDDGVDDIARARIPLTDEINSFYDHQFYSQDSIFGLLLGDTKFRNIGYWDETTPDQNAAAEKLQDMLLEMIPEKTGRILDVACGMGASTRRLAELYSPENVWAINISEKQIESTRENAKGCHVQVMSAVEMTFDNDFFDTIMCIEAAFHFETRRKFFDDSLRVLKQGGRLVLSDTLFTSKERLEQSSIFPSPENHIDTLEEYRQVMEEAGFRNIVVKDVSKNVWEAHFLYVINKIHEGFYHGRLSLIQLTEILWSYYYLKAITGICVFASGQK